MNEKEKFEQEFAEDGSFKVQGTPNDVWKWIEQHDQRILEEFVEWNVKDVVGNDPKAIKDSLKRVEQFMKEKND